MMWAAQPPLSTRGHSPPISWCNKSTGRWKVLFVHLRYFGKTLKCPCCGQAIIINTVVCLPIQSTWISFDILCSCRWFERMALQMRDMSSNVWYHLPKWKVFSRTHHSVFSFPRHRKTSTAALLFKWHVTLVICPFGCRDRARFHGRRDPDSLYEPTGAVKAENSKNYYLPCSFVVSWHWPASPFIVWSIKVLSEERWIKKEIKKELKHVFMVLRRWCNFF